jgi:hypothetical protein
MTFRFYIFPLDNISSKTTRTAFFIAKINKVSKIIICIHHNLEVSLLLLLQRTEIISAALFVILWRTTNLGRPVIELTSKGEAGIMFN